MCRTKLTLSSICRKDQECQSGLCYNTRCTSSTSRPNGAACTVSTSCSSGNCQNSICAAKKSTGGACYKDANCSSGKCDTKKGTCTASNLLANGKACTTSPSCSSGNCQNSKCAAKQSTGSSCYKDVNCVSGTCDKTTGKCAAAGTSPPSGGVGSDSGPPTPTSKTALPNRPPQLPSGDGVTTDADFVAQQPVTLAGSTGTVQQTIVNNVPVMQVTVPAGGSSSFTLSVAPPPAEVLRNRDAGSPAGMIITYQYQLQSMIVGDKWQGSNCFIYPTYDFVDSGTTDAWGDDLKPLKIFQVDPAWVTTQSYGRYTQGTAWTTFTFTAMCEAGVSGVINIASISHTEGDAPTVTNFYPVPDVTPVEGAEVFTNGGFESGTLAGWTDYKNAQVITGTAGGTVYAGTKAVQLTVGGAAGTTATISQVLSPLGAPALRKKRQINQGNPPSPFDQLVYETVYYMRVTAFDAPAGTLSGGSCSWQHYYDGHSAGRGNFVSDPVAQGWQTISSSDYRM